MAAFFNDLTNKPINPKHYEEALDLYKKLEFKTFREWLILY